MAHLLIVYGTTHGQTAKVVRRIAGKMAELGHQATLWRADALPHPEPQTRFDAVVVAGSVQYGRYQKAVEEFVRWNLGRLNTRPTAFVSVCGALAGNWAAGTAEADRYVKELCRVTGWQPTITRSFAGAVRYTEYGMLVRLMMKLISWRTGRPTDTSRDWEFTDWQAVDAFAVELAGRLPQSSPGTAPSPSETTAGSARHRPRHQA